MCSVWTCQATSEESILARVNGEPIRIEEFRDRLNEYRGESRSESPYSPDFLALKQRVLSELIEERVILAEGRKRGVQVSPRKLDDAIREFEKDYPAGGLEAVLAKQRISRSRWRDRMRLKILLEDVISEITKDVKAPSDREIEEYYKKNAPEFEHQEQAKVQQIVVKTAEDGEKVLRELQKGKPFEELAQIHSFTPEAQQGGNLGYVPRGVLPEPVDAALFELKVGETSKAILSEYGFHVLRLTDRRPARHDTLEEARPKIIRTLTQKDREGRFSLWRQEVLSSAKIERNHALLAKIH